MKNFLGVLLLLFIVAGAFAIHPLVGLALLITAVWGVLHFRSKEKKREQDFQEEMQALDQDNEAIQALIDEQRAEAERLEQVTKERVAAMTPQEKKSYEHEMQYVAALEQEIARLVGTGTVVYHQNREKLKWEWATCRNGHMHPYRQGVKNGFYHCPTCNASQFTFGEEKPGQFLFCPNRIVTVKMQQEWQCFEFLHSFATELTECPVCAWAKHNNFKIVLMENPPSDRNGELNRQWADLKTQTKQNTRQTTV